MKLITFLLWLPTMAFAHLNPPQFIPLLPEEGLAMLSTEGNQKPKTFSLSVYETPKKESKILGTIEMIVTPGKGVVAQFVDQNKKSQPLAADSKQTNWDYSSYFEFTLSDVKGDWIQLPKRPFPSPVWVHLKTKPLKMATDTVYTHPTLGNIVVTKFEGSKISYRKENDNDMLCGDEPSLLKPEVLKETTISVETLFDRDGHLNTWLTYTEGC